MARCPHEIDLEFSRCSYCEGDKGGGPAERVPAIGPVFNARHPGVCGHCDERFDQETPVCAALVDGQRVWAIADHTRRANDGSEQPA